MVTPQDIKKGAIVSIYEKPYTFEMLEGKAKILNINDADPIYEGIFVNCLVKFTDDNSQAYRTVFVQNYGKNNKLIADGIVAGNFA